MAYIVPVRREAETDIAIGKELRGCHSQILYSRMDILDSPILGEWPSQDIAPAS